MLSPGLKLLTMARRHPSSDLSICMSFILRPAQSELCSQETMRTGNEKITSSRPKADKRMQSVFIMDPPLNVFQSMGQVLKVQR